MDEVKWNAVTRMSREKNWDGELLGNVLTRSELASLYDAAIAALQEAGYRVVPYEPTHEMCEAGHVADPTFKCDDAEDIPRAYYQAMIDAA